MTGAHRASEPWVGGADLAGRYYRDVVRPLLDARWPGLPHAAARLGSGSDVLGLDDEMSRDHDFGLRLTLLVDRDQVAAVDEHLERALPDAYDGWPTRFTTSWAPAVRHQVQVASAADFAAYRLGLGVEEEWDAVDWLSLTGQSVLEVTAGPVFADTDGALRRVRERLAWYPDDVWRYVVAADWQRIDQELPFVGRTAARGDDLGSRLLTGHLARVCVHLGFLLTRRWAPYDKWQGTVFATLPGCSPVAAALAAALEAGAWPQRQDAVGEALAALLTLQRDAGLPAPARAVQPFFDRPYLSVPSSVGDLLLRDVRDPMVCRLPRGVGSVEQWVDNVDVLADPRRRVPVVRSWRALLAADRALPAADRALLSATDASSC